MLLATGVSIVCVCIPGGGGGDLVSIMPIIMCVFKSEGNGFFFRLQVNEMNEEMSFKMGAKFAASFYMGKNFLNIWHVFVC